LVCIPLLCTGYGFAQTRDTIKQVSNDTIPKDFYRLKDDRLPFQQPAPLGLNLKDPPNITKTIEFDPVTKEYVFKEKVGKMDYSVPYSLGQKDYVKYYDQNSTKNYWVERRKIDKGQANASFMPKINLGGEAFDKIFGSNTINIVPQGTAELIFGLNTQRTDNPNISQNLRKTTTFDFQEKIQMNVTGSIGDKMKLGINYNTEATFDFENKTKLEYTGKEDEIVKKIEAGNVTLPLSGTLITGSQSLFGIKTELQFGKLTVTSVISQQKGQSSVINVKGGAQVSQFNIPVDQYDANKHFFLAQFFRDKYEDALKHPPLVTSGVTITKIEVWVTNKSSNFTDARNIVAFLDLGEANTWNKGQAFNAPVNADPKTTPAYNEVNGLYNKFINQPGSRLINNISNILFSYRGFNQGEDYEKIESARRLTSQEFTLNPVLGFISLNTALNADEVLGVAYEYTYNGKTYQVGELSSMNTNSSEALVVKLLKNSNFTPKLPNWDLMMKNVYSINAYQVNPANFQLNIMYQDDKTGASVNYIPDDSKEVLLEKLNLDRLNSNGEAHPDGVFDFIEGVTITASNGRIFFPTLEPFGKTVDDYLAKAGLSQAARSKYVYSELYTNTQTNARQVAEKDKYSLSGSYESAGGGSDISLNAMNVPQGSVVVTAGGRKLQENIDYTVDYTLGRVKIINSGLLQSGTPIQVSLESNSLFNFQTKTLLGTHLDYKFSDNFNLGATVMNLTERPLTTKVNIGDEPISNTIWGLNGTYTTKSQFLTTMLDKIPFLDVKEPSTLTVDGEFAQLIPGHSKAISKSGTAYIDDFEGSETPIDMKSFQSWSLASTPADQSLFPEAVKSNDLSYGFNRAKLAWYQIDPLFLRNTSATPGNIKNNTDIQENPFVREIFETDIFKNKDVVAGIPSNIPVLNLAFYPKERGPYNYDTTNVSKTDGSLLNPEQRWGGIQREVTQTDFETANIEYIEFWMMDPFVLDAAKKHTDGSLYFDLGDVSEDVLKDSRKSFENGLPTTATTQGLDSTVWGYIPQQQALVDAFATTGREYQDVGLDGQGDSVEDRYFDKYLNALAKISPAAYAKARKDPSSDDFKYFLDPYYDANKTDILGRYKNYNGLEGNSPVNNSLSGQTFSSSILPNTEDINHDNTLNESENFFQYKVDLTPEKLKIGTNFIVDSVSQTITYKGVTMPVNWYQFRIPITDYQKVIGSIQDFKSIRFMRMFLKGFSDSIILRFARLDLVRGEWRKYSLTLRQGGETLSTPEETDPSFDISAVNIEDNAGKRPVNYVLPPGVSRQTDPTNPQVALLNEQSMVLKVNQLSNGDGKAAYKNVNLDIRQYKRLQMDVHAEQIPNTYLQDNELTLFIRLGSDYTNNFYEYEIPLKLTPWNTNSYYSNNSDQDRLAVWPDSNRIDIALSDFQLVKQIRNNELNQPGSNLTSSMVFPYVIEGQRGKYYVCGNPNLSNIKTLMIGVRYPYDSRKTGQVRAAEVWVDELRVSDFNEKGGWAANLRVTSRLSDFGTVSLSGNTSTPGFGSIEQKLNERNKEYTYNYDLASNLELGKFFSPKSGIQIPMFIGYSKDLIIPEYNPLDPDVELSTSLKSLSSEAERQRLKNIVQDVTERQSINFTNVRINKKGGKPHFYDISNLSLNYSFNQTYNRNINTEKNLQKSFLGGLMYAFQPRAKNIAPFQNWKLFRSNAFRLFRDFNFQLIPTNLSFRTDMSRSYNEIKLRNINNISGLNSLNSLTDTNFLIKPTVNKDFLWNRYYGIGWDLTRSLKIDFTASNIARIDEPDGIVNKFMRSEYRQWKDSVWHNILRGGRTTHYQHDLNVNYTIPINKLPLLGWTSANARYTANYNWDAGSISYPTLGNTISNSNQLQLNGQLTFSQLYNKVPYFRKVTQPPLPKAQQPKRYKKVTFQIEKTLLLANEPKGIFHGLGTKDVTVKVFDASGKEIKGKTNVLNENKVTFTTDKDYKGVKINVEGKVEVKPSPIVIILDNLTRLILSVKNFNISWSRNQGTTLPGFMPKSRMLGMSDGAYQNAPGWDFVFGIQDRNFGNRAIANHWLSTDPLLNMPMMMLYNERLSLRSTLEPIPGFRIEVTAARSYTRNQNSYYSASDQSFINQQQSGNFSMSFIALGSAFQKLKMSDNYHSHVFDIFKQNREIIASRLGLQRQAQVGSDNYDPSIFNPDGGVNGYGYTSQEVLIPAFMAAYGGISPSRVTLERFPSVFYMMPNWRINYDGLSKIGFIQKFAKSVTLTHSYTATYSVGNYLSNMEYDLQDYLTTLRDMQDNFIPQINMASVSIAEQFGPLIGVDVTFVNSLSTKFEIRKSRNILLSLSNNQLTETSSDEVVAGAGYKIKDFKFILKDIAGGQKKYKSDLNLRADVSVRDNKTILRRFTNEGDQPSSGQKVVTIKVSADYLISDKFTFQVFYNRIVNTPIVLLSYPTATTDFGFSLRFSLAQ
jgi:cell surface protein SprA